MYGPTGLLEYLRILWRRRATILATVVLLVGASIAYSVVKKPVYQATASLELTPQLSSAVLQANNATTNSAANVVDVPTDIQVLQSRSVAAKVRAKLPGAPSVSVSEVGTTNVVNVSVSSTNPELAAKAANLYANTYIKTQQYESTTALSDAVNIVQARINALGNQINTLTDQAQSAKGSSVQSIQAQIATLQQSQTVLSQQIGEYQTAASLVTGGGQVVSSATVPTSPVAPKPLEYGLLALAAGIVVGSRWR